MSVTNSARANASPPGEFDAWHPGLDVDVPRDYLPLSTIFRPENVTTGIAKACELADYCGLPVQDLVAFRPERLIVHELLIHVTTGVSVPDTGDYEALGRNFREIAATILERYIAPHRAEIARAFEETRAAAAASIARELDAAFAAPNPVAADAKPGWHGFFGNKKKRPPLPAESPAERERRIVSDWGRSAEAAVDRRDEACFAALHRIGTAVMGRRGRLLGDKALLTELAVTLMCNDCGSEVIGELLLPYFEEAVAREGFRRLPRQDKPVVMNVKGASASGKSTMRPLQHVLADKLRLPWHDFALISPDIWRKFLLDYASLGAAYKYAGALTGHENEIVDKKLDARMAARAARGEMSHLLIDRFRFDSFVPEFGGGSSGSTRLLTRFGDLVYMFFMITPPEATVERAWLRGLKVGRYKAVEDLLAHNVEAYTGMPELFFTWALSAGKRVHYEFLDNSVRNGEPPRTAAFGWNGEMTVLDIRRMLDIERFRRINIHAQNRAEVYAGEDLSPARNLDFLKRCARWIPAINFADRASGAVYARLERGRWVWRDEAKFAAALEEPDARAGLLAVAPNVVPAAGVFAPNQADIAGEKVHTLGAWGEAARPS